MQRLFLLVAIMISFNGAIVFGAEMTFTPTPSGVSQISLTPVPAPHRHKARKLTPSPTQTPTPAESFSLDQIKGCVGIGVSNIPLVGTAASVRYWEHPDEAYDFYLGFYENPNAGLDFNGFFNSLPNWGYGLGVGIHHNWKKPTDWVEIQWIARLIFSQNFNKQSGVTSELTTEYQDLSLGFGPGFEAFIPFWKNISVEGNILLNIDSRWKQTLQRYNPVYYSNPLDSRSSDWILSLGLNNSIESIFNASVHFYF